MKKGLLVHAKRCPVHPEETLKFNEITIKLPGFQEGMVYTFENYCPKCDKYLVKKNMASVQETALIFINHNYKKNYSSNEIQVSKLENISR